MDLGAVTSPRWLTCKQYDLRAVGQSGALQVVLAGKLRITEASTSIVREAGHEIVDCMHILFTARQHDKLAGFLVLLP